MSLVASLLDRVSPQSLQQLRASDRTWQALRLENPLIPTVINQSQESLGETDFDLVIAGGTLGSFIGAALQTRCYGIIWTGGRWWCGWYGWNEWWCGLIYIVN